MEYFPPALETCRIYLVSFVAMTTIPASICRISFLCAIWWCNDCNIIMFVYSKL